MTSNRSQKVWITYVIIGIVAGFLSGFFGVGGGTVIVPALLFFAGFGQRLAAGTSLAAIVAPSIVGMIGYIPSGSVDWIAGSILAIGSIIGAQIGSWLLDKLPVAILRWIFVAFLAFVGVDLFFTVPDRSVELAMSFGTISGLILLGLVTGLLAGLIGVGGGIIVVPALMLLFGVSDLIAKGTSLLMILPTSLSGTIGNMRRKNIDLTAALIVGISAALCSFIGVQVAFVTPPQIATILFAVYVLILVVRMTMNAIKPKRND